MKNKHHRHNKVVKVVHLLESLAKMNKGVNDSISNGYQFSANLIREEFKIIKDD